MIYVYDDNTHDTSVLFSQLRKDFRRAGVSRCNADDVFSGGLNPASDVLIVPGGKDLNYCKDLNGKGTKIIREFVHKGGGYLGLCAGAYFGSREISWAEGTEQAASGPRELALVDCRAIGPVENFIESLEGCWFNAVTVSFNEAVFSALYTGGPVFEVSGNCDVLARYTDLPGSPPSVVGNRFGRGYAILCSPHLEAAVEEFESRIYHTNPYFEKLLFTARKMRNTEEKQKAAWIEMIGRLIPA